MRDSYFLVLAIILWWLPLGSSGIYSGAHLVIMACKEDLYWEEAAIADLLNTGDLAAI